MLKRMKLTTQDKITITNNFGVELHTKFTKNKSAYLRANPKGYIQFSRPIWMSDINANDFVSKNIEKMKSILQGYRNQKPYSLDEDFIMVYGVEHKLNFEPGRKYNIVDNLIIIKGTNKETALSNFIKKHSEIMLDRARDISKKLDVNVEFSLSNSRSYWGICYPTRKVIKLSTRLMHLDWEVIDYVIAHEIAHLYVPNHSKKFWDIVEKWVPNYKEIKKRLKRW